MSRRHDTDESSRINLQIRATREERDRAQALAEYQNLAVGKPYESVSDLVRRLLAAERQRLVNAGCRPPLKPRAQRHADSKEDESA